MVNKKYYERPGGFSYHLNELREKKAGNGQML